jgi:hypothetical protein
MRPHGGSSPEVEKNPHCVLHVILRFYLGTHPSVGFIRPLADSYDYNVFLKITIFPFVT